MCRNIFLGNLSLNEGRCLIDPNVDIRIKQKTTKLCFFTSNKDKTPPLSRSNVVYEFTCPGCNSSYIGKTIRTLLVRTQEHALTDKESAIYKHLHYCDQIKHIQGLYSLPDVFVNENNPPSIAQSLSKITCFLFSQYTLQTADFTFSFFFLKMKDYIRLHNFCLKFYPSIPSVRILDTFEW